MGRERLAADDPKRGRGGAQWRALLDELVPPGSICHLCKKKIRFDVPPRHPMSRSLDHVRPLSKGGHPTARENLKPAHFGCNSGRGNRPVANVLPVRSRRW
jgi:5-methylcytosine-specific restriction endonuclease McrA